MEKVLRLKTYVDGGINDTPFPNLESQVEIGEFRYDAKRMGGAPTITASVNYPSCLDDEWADNVYAEFNGEKYFLKQTPTSSYNNESTMYKHDLELISERSILDNVYFFNAVDGVVDEVSVANKLPQSNEWQLFGNIDPTKAYSKLVARYYDGSMVGVFEPVPLDTDIRIVSGPPIDLKIDSDTGNIYLLDRYNYFSSLGLHLTFLSANYADKPLSNSTKVVFFGNIHEFVSRMNASLANSGVGYDIVVDEGITTEEKLMSFEDQFFSNVLQEIYNTYEVPYYFEGRTIHIGYSKEDVVIPDLEYGVDNALVSITKNNANVKIVNRVTGKGSSDNIPFYYPNNSPKGDIEATTSRSGLDVKIFDYEKFSNEIGIGDSLVYSGAPLVTLDRVVHKNGGLIPSGGSYNVNCGYLGFIDEYKMYVDASKETEITLSLTPNANFSEYDGSSWNVASFTSTTRIFVNGRQITKNGFGYVFDVEVGENVINIYVDYKFDYRSVKSTFTGDAGITYSISPTDTNYWTLQDRKVDLLDFGLFVEEGSIPQHGDTITQTLVKYVNTSQNLMPSIYRETDGAERFYNAINGEYTDEEGNAIVFNNPYVDGRPKEHIVSLEDIKPTIKETFVNDLRIDMFSEFAYDEDDNDETYEDEDGNVYFKHPYFYGKLRVMDFNLFDHAIEQQPMTISFTSGHAGACNFEIGVTEDYPQKNPVQVDEDGNLVRDENGMIVAGVEGIQQFVTKFQERQQDTSKYEVWIALRKEESTYGILMPQVAHRPKACTEGQNDGDTFVILGINLPQSYILNAEKKLESELIKYMKENNDEKFTFNINFSRIYFAENENILKSLNENSKVRIVYNKRVYDLYVSSFSYSISDGDILPDIKVELDDTLKVSENAIRNAINEVKTELGRAINNVDVVGAGSPYFLRKDEDDEARGRINFQKGLTFGNGGKVDILDDNSAKLTIDYIDVKKKATFTSLEIQEKTHVGGQVLVTPAAMSCNNVEELDDCYRCYFQTDDEGGDEIFNQFTVGDQAICQTLNAWESKYYWRLVVGLGENYIDLSKEDCDENSDIPAIGDKIIQLGNREDSERQNAIVIAAYGDDSPYIIQYKGINSFALSDDKIVTKLSSTENIFTGKVHMELGSDGLDSLPEWIEVRNTANEALEKAGSIGEEALEELEAYIDEVRQDLQDQIDGAVDNYFEDYEPDTDNFPAKDWNTEEEKYSHLNDTFTNLTDGRSWRWSKVAGNYTWVEIADTATSEALRVAGQAKASADGKIRMFVTRPTPPYSVGDLWSRGEDAPLMCCTRSKDTGTFNEEDWDLADNSQAYTDNAINNIKIGGENLLRNSGFTGDYLSERLADESVLLGAEELYSPPFDHWEINADINRVELPNDAASGYGVDLGGSFIQQKLYYNISIGEQYVVSFKAKNKDAQSLNLVNIEIGGESSSILVNNELKSYSVVLQTKTTDNRFTLSGDVIVCDLKLEKGNKATSWSASPLDNASDRAYYQSLKYIQNAFEGATDILGGLVLTELIQVGDFNKEEKKWKKMTAGMSGVYESDNDVAFWAGGDLEHAIETVMRYEDNPAYQPTEAELATMAKFVITHGGRAILNDIILRGTVYATDGEFTGTIESTSGHIGGFQISGNRIGIDQGGTNNGMFLYDSFIGFRESGSSYNSFTAVGENVLSATSGTTGLARFELDGSKDSFNQYTAGYGLMVDVKGYGNPYAFYCPNGVFAGLRPKTKVITSAGTYTINEFEHTIIINANNGGVVTLKLNSNPQEGQEYVIYTAPTSVDLTIDANGKTIYNLIDAQSKAQETFTADKRRWVKLIFAGGIWWQDYRYLEK